MTAWGHRSLKGPVHGEDCLQKGSAALFMSLYYIKGGWFLYLNRNKNKQVIQIKKGRWGLARREQNLNERGGVKGVDGRQCVEEDFLSVAEVPIPRHSCAWKIKY